MNKRHQCDDGHSPAGFVAYIGAQFASMPLHLKAQDMRTLPKMLTIALLTGAMLAILGTLPARAADTFTKEEILAKAHGFFGTTTKGLADAVQKVFADKGAPNAVILGEEVSGAIGVGLRYGNGELDWKAGPASKVYWQGPSIGFDFGGNASKVFTLVYNLQNIDQLYQRYPGVDGSFYFVAGVGVNYQQAGNVIMAPMRTGVGLRAGASVGYLHYNKEHSWLPF